MYNYIDPCVKLLLFSYYAPAALAGGNLPQLLTTLATLQPEAGSLQTQMIKFWEARTQEMCALLPQLPKWSLCSQ